MNYTDLTKVSLKFKSLSGKTIVIIINYLLFVVIMRLTPTQSLHTKDKSFYLLLV